MNSYVSCRTKTVPSHFPVHMSNHVSSLIKVQPYPFLLRRYALMFLKRV
jgi:hypothetical protein